MANDGKFGLIRNYWIKLYIWGPIAWGWLNTVFFSQCQCMFVTADWAQKPRTLWLNILFKNETKSWYWNGTSLQRRLMRVIFSNANDMKLFLMIFPRMSLHLQASSIPIPIIRIWCILSIYLEFPIILLGYGVCASGYYWVLSYMKPLWDIVHEIPENERDS